jgi:PE family
VSFVTTQPEAPMASAGNLQGIGAAMSTANGAAAAPTTGAVPAAADGSQVRKTSEGCHRRGRTRNPQNRRIPARVPKCFQDPARSARPMRHEFHDPSELPRIGAAPRARVRCR